MKVINHAEISTSKWQNYVDRHQHGSIFHTPYIHNIFAVTPNYRPFSLFVLNDKDKITAMLSGFIQTIKPGILARLSTRSVLLQSPIYDDLDALNVLISYYIRWIKHRAIYTEVRNHIIDDQYSSLLISQGFLWEGHFNIIREIPPSADQLWKEIGRKRKDGINKAKRFNFTIELDNSLETTNDLYQLLSENYRQLRLPIPRKSFFDQCVTSDDMGYCKLFKLTENSTTKIVLLSYLFNGTLYAVYIGSNQDSEFVNKRPVDYFYYEVLRWCVENGVRHFDWLGAGKPGVSYGVRDFKLQYGGELVDYGRFLYHHNKLLFRIAESGFSLLQRFKGRI